MPINSHQFKLTSFALIGLIASSLLLSACLPKKETTTKTNPISNSTGTNSISAQQAQKAPTMPAYKELNDFKVIEASQATLVTTKGDITIELYRDKAPLTTANFLDLVDKGFYDGIVFHRVIPDFMAQVGDPLTKEVGMEGRWGTGGPGYQIKDEFGEGLIHNEPGVVSMANSGPNTGGSQFFITHVPTAWLDGKHAVFGKVIAGLDVLMEIEQGDKINSVTLK